MVLVFTFRLVWVGANYFLYIPLAFIIGDQFTKDDLNRLVKQTLLFSIPVAVLVVSSVVSTTRGQLLIGGNISRLCLYTSSWRSS